MTINLYQALASLKIWTLYLNRQSVRKNTKNKNTHQYIIYSNDKNYDQQNKSHKHHEQITNNPISEKLSQVLITNTQPGIIPITTMQQNFTLIIK